MKLRRWYSCWDCCPTRSAGVKTETMVLKYIFPIVDLTRDEFLGVGADLISIVKLLTYWLRGTRLRVLDEVTISGSQMDKDVLRMSLGNVSMKKNTKRSLSPSLDPWGKWLRFQCLSLLRPLKQCPCCILQCKWHTTNAESQCRRDTTPKSKSFVGEENAC